MSDNHNHENEAHLACEVCMKEIPKSVAQSYEGPDYVFYFCGTECFNKWKHQKNSGVENKEAD